MYKRQTENVLPAVAAFGIELLSLLSTVDFSVTTFINVFSNFFPPIAILVPLILIIFSTIGSSAKYAKRMSKGSITFERPLGLVERDGDSFSFEANTGVEIVIRPDGSMVLKFNNPKKVVLLFRKNSFEIENVIRSFRNFGIDPKIKTQRRLRLVGVPIVSKILIIGLVLVIGNEMNPQLKGELVTMGLFRLSVLATCLVFPTALFSAHLSGSLLRRPRELQRSS